MTYQIVVSDDNLCSATGEVTLLEPDEIVIETLQNDPVCFGEVADISVVASGGRGPYTYFWNDSGTSGSVLEDVASNFWTLTVTDANGCTAQKVS